MQLISDEPPALANGNVTPVSGIILVTPPTIMNVCTASISVAPSAIRLWNAVEASSAMRSPRIIKKQYSANMPTANIMPNSSHMAANMKSV